MKPEPNSRFKLLVVDDDPSVLATYYRLLSRAGYSTRVESDPGQVLLDGSVGDEFDLLLLDQKMPGMDGLTLLSELRRRDCRARCVLVSASLDKSQHDQARALGVDRILEKPVDATQLRQTIDDLLTLMGS